MNAPRFSHIKGEGVDARHGAIGNTKAVSVTPDGTTHWRPSSM